MREERDGRESLQMQQMDMRDSSVERNVNARCS